MLVMACLRKNACTYRARAYLIVGLMLDCLGEPYDTSELKSSQAGRGFAICAFIKDGEEGDFLASSHTLRGGLPCFHHSSFFAGEPVHFAGEIKVTKGRLEVLTHKSG